LFTGIKHEDILSELENEINLEDIKSIQMTEKSCIVTLKSEQAKYKILNSEISLKNRSVNFFEIDKNVTNVTIKDAPCEVSDQFIATHMSKYGQVINGSIKRGVIKGISKKLTDLFFNEISELRILYFACSLFSVTIQDFSVIWIDVISSKFISFSNSDNIFSCLIPVSNLLLKCTDNFLFIFSILP
jgi:hypothetical protein